MNRVINKNNGTITITKLEANTSRFATVKTLEEYNVIVEDKEGIRRLESVLKVVRINNTIKYKLAHNSRNKALINYVIEELKKYKYIKT